MFRGIKTIFIDVDDTLWWFTENSKVALRQTYEDFGGEYWPCDYDTFQSVYHKHNAELWDLHQRGELAKEVLVKERFKLTMIEVGCDPECDDLAMRMNDHYLTVLAQQPNLMPGARELLEYLVAKGYDVNVLSNGFKGVQQQKLVSGGIDHLIRHVVLSDDCGVTKPLPGIFEYALKMCHTTATASLMIGDNAVTDIQGAHEAGWRTIYFDWRGIEPPTGVADATVSILDEIKALL